MDYDRVVLEQDWFDWQWRTDVMIEQQQQLLSSQPQRRAAAKHMYHQSGKLPSTSRTPFAQ